jgi:hypothetical protein
MSESKRFVELVEQMKEVHRAKNAGYSGADAEDPWRNFRVSEMFDVPAFTGCLVRMSDKFIRITNLVKDNTNDQVGEAVTDTLMDLANYAIIAICLYEENQHGLREPAHQHSREMLYDWQKRQIFGGSQ